MIDRIHPIVEAYVLSSVPAEDKDSAQQLLDLAKTFSSVGIHVYRECIIILVRKLDLNIYDICRELTKAGVDSLFIDTLYPELPF